MNDISVLLTDRDAVVADISTPPEEQHFAADPDIEVGNVELRLGRAPLIKDLSQQSQITGQALAPELKYLETRFRVVLLTTSLSVLKLSGSRRVSALEYTLDFDSNTEVAIIDMLPRSEIIDRVQVSIGTNSNVMAVVNAKGEFDIKVPVMSAGASVSASSENRASILANFSYVFHSIRTQAIGVYGKTAIWSLVGNGRPLVGDFVFATTMLVDQLVESIKFKVRLAATISRLGLFPEKRLSGWTAYELDAAAASASPRKS